MVSGDYSHNGRVGQKHPKNKQTTLERAKAATEAAAAVRPPPSPVVSSKDKPTVKSWFNFGSSWLSHRATRAAKRVPYFNPEVLTNQKREWSYLQKRSMVHKMMEKPTALFEHFVVVGLHPNADVEATEAAFKAKKVAEMTGRDRPDGPKENPDYRGYAIPALEPQVLFKYPPAKRLSLRDLPAFCFPNGVQARVMERTPSMSEFNEVVYGQSHLRQDDQSFVFRLKVANNNTLYGVCMLVQEIVQRPPGILAMHSSASSPAIPLSKFLISAPRCYCILTQLPFFDLHFEVLNSILAQERFDRIKQHIVENEIPILPTMCQRRADSDSWMDSAIPASVLRSIEEEPPGTMKGRKLYHFRPDDDSPFEDDAARGDEEEELDSREAAGTSGTPSPSSVDTGAGGGGVGENSTQTSPLQQRTRSSGLFPSISARSYESEDELVDAIALSDDYGVSATKKWAQAKGNDSLRILCAYHSIAVPPPGDTVVFQPLEHLHPIIFTRPPAAHVVTRGQPMDPAHLANCVFVGEPSAISAALMSVEEAQLAAPWAIATVCRAMGLENILTMFQAALLEKQILVVCPNLGILSAVVISLIPMLQPFVWQSVLLPILPADLFAFLDAPVPFTVGVQYKTPEVRQKSGNLIRVNVYKDQVKLHGFLPPLPQYAQLLHDLQPFHASLAAKPNAMKQPVHKTTEEQAMLAKNFLAVLRKFTETLCADLQLHSITDVRPGGDRVSLLLKDSFVASYAPKDRHFVKLFSDTQLFAVHSDAVLSSTEVG